MLKIGNKIKNISLKENIDVIFSIKFLTAISVFFVFIFSFISNYKIETIIIKLSLSLFTLLLVIKQSGIKRIKLKLNESDLFLLVFVFYLFISLIWSKNQIFGLLKIIQIIILIIPLYVFIKLNLFESLKREFQLTAVLFLCFNLFLSIYIIIFTPMQFSNYGIIKQEISQVFSGRLLTLSILLIIFYLTRNFNPNKIFVLLYILISSIALGITSFRAGILGLLLVLIVYYLLNHSQLRNKYLLPAVFIFLAGLLISSQFNENLIKRFHWIESLSQEQKIFDSTVNSRIKAYEMSFSMFYEKPIQGFGAGGFNSIYKNSDLGKWIKYPHNIFLELIAETGLIGTILFLIIFIKSVKSTLKTNVVEFKYVMLFLFILSLFSKDLSTNIILLLPAISNHKIE